MQWIKDNWLGLIITVIVIGGGIMLALNYYNSNETSTEVAEIRAEMDELREKRKALEKDAQRLQNEFDTIEEETSTQIVDVSQNLEAQRVALQEATQTALQEATQKIVEANRRAEQANQEVQETKQKAEQAAREVELKFLQSEPGTQIVRTTEDAVIRRTLTAHGTTTTVRSEDGEEITIIFRPSGPLEYVFPTHEDDPSSVELGLQVGDKKYAPPIDKPDQYKDYVWHQVTNPDHAGRHAMAVIDTDNVWALVKVNDPSSED